MRSSSQHINTALVQEAMVRARDRIRRGEIAARHRLPDQKADWPKALFLDLNKWVDLARAHYGRPGGEAWRPALATLRTVIGQGRVVVPLTQQNIEEAGVRRDRASRERLARFMVDLSGNHSMIGGPPLILAEIARALRSTFPGQKPRARFRSNLLCYGMAPSYGRRLAPDTGDSGMDRLLLETLQDPALSVAMVVGALNDQTIDKTRTIDQVGAERLAGIRALDVDLDPTEKRRRELVNLVKDGTFADQMREVVAELALGREAFEQWIRSEENQRRFCALVPAVDIPGELMFLRDRNRNAHNDANDVKDLEFLRVGIAYGNLVVTEKLWAHLASTSGLSSRYDAVVISDLRQLPAELTRLGC
jgi:hypothetical protein